MVVVLRKLMMMLVVVLATTRSSLADGVRFTESVVDQSAGGIECFKIETSNATYFLDKVGAGLSSLVDRDGNDWLGFHPKKGSGAAGEYRGFPNAVFKSAGSYFHAQNSGTDPCVTIVEEVSPSRVVIAAIAGNGKWSARYTFTESACTFTVTKKPADHNYWVLYEGTPGGQYDDSDWWMTSGDHKKRTLAETHDGDIAADETGSEWIAFGDAKLKRSLFIKHHSDDNHADHFYQMEKKMTVFGFGRNGMKRHLDSVPQSFSIGLAESADYQVVQDAVGKLPDAESASDDQLAVVHRSLERFALTHRGDAAKGKKLFAKDLRTRCAVCHRVGKVGGSVGPDLSKIGGKFDRPHLIESLLTPSKQVVESYRTSVVVTTDGRVLAGIVKFEDDNEIKIVDGSDKATAISKADIDYRREIATSMMPTGLADSLSPQEFTDLVAYLESLQSGKSRFGSGVSGPIELPDGFAITTIATGLSGAVAMQPLPDGRILICEQHGELRVVKDGQLLEKPMLKLSVEHNWERGLIGVTVSPDFPNDPHVYVVYVTDKPHTHHRISRFRVDGDVAVPSSEEILLSGDDQSQFGGHVPAGHQGGAIHFGNDGKLYVGIGEQTAKTPSQRFDALQGKILRINPDGSIPRDNPFLKEASGKYQSIWAMGCRNPFTFAVDRRSGLVLINDVGGKFEEINRGVSGANYGWPTVDHGPTDREGLTGPNSRLP